MEKRRENRIEALLKERKMTQKELHKETGISESSISHYVNGTRVPRGANLLKIARFFGVTTDYILGDGGTDCSEINTVKTLIARNAARMTNEEKLELVKMLMER